MSSATCTVPKIVDSRPGGNKWITNTLSANGAIIMKSDVFNMLPVNTIRTNKMLKELPQFSVFEEIVSNFMTLYTIKVANVNPSDFQAMLRKHEQNPYNQTIQDVVNMAKSSFIYIYQHLSTHFGVDDFVEHYKRILHSRLDGFLIPMSFIEKNSHKTYNDLIRTIKSHMANTWSQKNSIPENTEILIEYIIQSFLRKYIDETYTLADIYAMPLVDMKYNRIDGFHTKAPHLCSYYSMFIHEPLVHEYYTFLFDAYVRYAPQCYIKKFDLYKPIPEPVITEEDEDDVEPDTPDVQTEEQIERLLKQFQQPSPIIQPVELEMSEFKADASPKLNEVCNEKNDDTTVEQNDETLTDQSDVWAADGLPTYEEVEDSYILPDDKTIPITVQMCDCASTTAIALETPPTSSANYGLNIQKYYNGGIFFDSTTYANYRFRGNYNFLFFSSDGVMVKASRYYIQQPVLVHITPTGIAIYSNGILHFSDPRRVWVLTTRRYSKIAYVKIKQKQLGFTRWAYRNFGDSVCVKRKNFKDVFNDYELSTQFDALIAMAKIQLV